MAKTEMGKKKCSSTNITKPKKVRLQKAAKWVENYKGQHVVRSYRKQFHVDILTAISDLQEVGIKFSEEYISSVKKSEEKRIQLRKLKKEQKKLQDLYPNSNDVFAYIAGYTSGGAPFGTTWEELGLEPYASEKELEEAYEKQWEAGMNSSFSEEEYEDLPF